jgi:hypothetical protein
MTEPGIGRRRGGTVQGHFEVLGGVASDQDDRMEELAGLLNIDVKDSPCRLRLQGHHREPVPHDVVHVDRQPVARRVRGAPREGLNLPVAADYRRCKDPRRMPDSVQLPDGRPVGYAECGDPHGAPLVYLHGAPGSRLEAGPEALFSAELAAAGVRLLGIDRAGYGSSVARSGRQIYEQAADVEGFADRLGLQRFAVVGWSSGGPVALATAARLPGRVTAVATIASIAPIDKVGLDGLGERAFFEQAMRDPEALRGEMKDL